MHILLFGATGGCGHEILHKAHDLGWQVTCLVRDPSKVHAHDGVNLIQGDISDSKSVDKVFASGPFDAVISALGVRKVKKNTILSQGTKTIMEAMKKHRVKRFLVITSLGVGDTKHDVPLWFRLVKATILRNVFADKEMQEQMVRASGLDWTIVQPGKLIDIAGKGEYKIWDTSKPERNRFEMPREDVADFIIKEIQEKKWVDKSVGISY
jgi:putative NADH-flavin reductase